MLASIFRPVSNSGLSLGPLQLGPGLGLQFHSQGAAYLMPHAYITYRNVYQVYMYKILL